MYKHKISWIFIIFSVALLLTISACQPVSLTPTLPFTPTLSRTSTPTPSATPMSAQQSIFQTFAFGQILPDMRVPIQRGSVGEGGWYVIIGSQEGWAQFLSRMGQPAAIWQSVDWEQEILIGALLGLRQGREQRIEITDLVTGGVEVLIGVDLGASGTSRFANSANQVTYPFHLVRVSRIELPLGPATFRFVNADGDELAVQTADVSDIDLIWLNGVPPLFPTPTPVQARATPLTSTATPVPNLQVRCIVLDVLSGERILRVVSEMGQWQNVRLTEGTSILQGNRSVSLGQLTPGTTIGVLGYADEEETVRAVHIDVLRTPAQTTGLAAYSSRSTVLSTIYSGYDLPLALNVIRAPATLTELLTISQTNMLTNNGFVARPADYASFAELYTDPRYADYPLFISADSVLHVSRMLFEHTRRTVERNHLMVELARLDREMFELSWAQYQAGALYKSTSAQAVAEAALQNAARFAVSLALLDDEFVPPEILTETVAAELALIRAAEGITVSPLFEGILLAPPAGRDKLYIDYSRFALQGQDETQRRYAQALIWHEQAGWRLQQPTDALAVVLLVHILDRNNVPRMLLDRLLTVRQFFGGRSSTLTVPALLPVYDRVWGDVPELFDLADPLRLDGLVQEAMTLGATLNAGQPTATAVDLTWAGTPLSLGRAILAQIAADDRVTTTVELSAVYLTAVLNVPEAYSVVNEMDNGAPVELLDRVAAALGARDPALWTTTADGLELGLYRTMLQDKSSAYPKWMRTRAWRRKELQTALGQWVDGQRTALPVVVGQRDAFSPSTTLWGYVEPQPQVYGQLAAWTQMLIEGLQNRLMLSEAESGMLIEWQSWLTTFQDVARRELTGQTITDLELQRLAGYGNAIAGLTSLALADLLTSVGPTSVGPTSVGPTLVGGVISYSLASQTVLSRRQEVFRVAAVGRVDELYVVVERGQQRFLTRGGVYSFYEFDLITRTLPDDLLWTGLLVGQPPPRPAWLSEILIP